jgi:transmembrane sensor
MSAQGSTAKDVNTQAAHWLERREFESWGEADEVELSAWLAQSWDHRVAYWRLKDAWEHTERLSVLRPSARKADAAPPRRTIRPTLLRIVAAVIAVVVLGAGLAVWFDKPVETVYATQIGGHQSVVLADGSKIELNTDTVLRARVGSHERLVTLDRGEAYFQIAHDPKHPFVVMAGDHRVTDLGTKFLVRRDNKNLEVAVTEGRVQLDTPDGRLQSPVLLTRHEAASVHDNKVFVTRKTALSLTNELGWRHGFLVFDHTTLADAVAEFNRYNKGKLVIADPAAARLTMDGTFPIDGVSAFTEVAQEVFKLHVTQHGENIVIAR